MSSVLLVGYMYFLEVSFYSSWLVFGPGSPRLLSLQIVGSVVEGTILSVDKSYWGGDEGESVFRWFRVLSSTSTSLAVICFKKFFIVTLTSTKQYWIILD